MKKNRFFFLFLLFALLLLFLPKEGAKRLRLWTAKAVTTVCPKGKKDQSNDVSGLALENHLLKLEIERLKQWLFEDETLKGEIQELKGFEEKEEDPFFERRKKYLHQILAKQLTSIPAQVVFREPASWSSRVWVNMGESENKLLGKKVIAKGSPVVVGRALVGIVENVLETRSQVRLITDPTLHLPVRAVRRGGQNRHLRDQTATLIQSLSLREDLNGSQEVAEFLGMFLDQFATDATEPYLAKGEIHGSSPTVCKTLGNTLKGEGFNYDFADEEGGPCQLRTGKVVEDKIEPLIRVGDLLVTTGMDGIIPADLLVGTVTKIHPLCEGGCSYALEAVPACVDFSRLTEVSILPPQ